jgi:hypothetical protein
LIGIKPAGIGPGSKRHNTGVGCRGDNPKYAARIAHQFVEAALEPRCGCALPASAVVAAGAEKRPAIDDGRSDRNV